jgi:hypothetical protein
VTPKKKPRSTKKLPKQGRRPAALAPDPRAVYEKVYFDLTAIIDKAPAGPENELVVLDAVISAAAHFAADSFSGDDVGPGVLKCVQLFAERMKETLVPHLEEG